VADMVITYRGTVYPWQCDHVGHMNVMWYVGKFDEGTWNFFHELGLTPAYFTERQRGMAAVQQNITYKKEVMAGEILYVRTGLLEVRERVLRFVHEMVNGATEETVAIADLTGVHLDRATRRACAMPEDVLARAPERIIAWPRP
jgi:acyl-CoA thioester hydrolase